MSCEIIVIFIHVKLYITDETKIILDFFLIIELIFYSKIIIKPNLFFIIIIFYCKEYMSLIPT